MAADISVDEDLAIQSFLIKAGRFPTSRQNLKGDLGSRRFERLIYKNGSSEVLMISMPETHLNFTPGHKLQDYVEIAQTLKHCGLCAPEIYEFDLESNLALMEDFGDMTFIRAIEEGASNEALTRQAAEVLEVLREVPADHLPDFMASHIVKGHKRFVDWYCPVLFGEQVSNELIESFLSVWDNIFDALPPPQQGFVYLDFHFGNLMLLENGQTGLLDFQGAMHGPLAYDMTNLLQDARRDTKAHIQETILNETIQGMTDEEAGSFRLWYDVLACHFHCRVIGQFIKLAHLHGKTQHLEHLPRLERYIRDNAAKSSVLEPLRNWLNQNNIYLNRTPEVNLDRLHDLIREDAI